MFNQDAASAFIITALRRSVAQQWRKSKLQVLSVLTVFWKTLALENPTLIVFYMRLYISSGFKVLVERMHVRFSTWGGSSFYGPERSELYGSDGSPSVLQLPAEISCLFISGIYSADSLAGTPATAEGIRFSLYLFASFFLLRKSSLLCDATGKLPSSSLSSPVKWDYREEGKWEIEDKRHNRAVIHCNHGSPLLLLFPFTYKIAHYIE